MRAPRPCLPGPVRRWWPLLLLLAPVAAGAAEGDGFSYLTPWFRTASIEPVLKVPDVISFGPTRRAEVRRGGAWREVYRGRGLQARVADGGRAVVVRDSGQVFREDREAPVQLPAGPCGGFAWGRIVVPFKLDRVACTHATSAGGCGRLEVSQYDLEGRLLRRDVLGAAPACTLLKGDRDTGSHALGGLTAEGDPVVAVQVGEEKGGRERHAILVLTPAGPRELGRFTVTVRHDFPWKTAWPVDLAALVVHPST